MADKNKSDKDEYYYDEGSDLNSDFVPVEQQASAEDEDNTQPSNTRPVHQEQLDIKRLVLAVITVILLAFFAYKIVTWIFSSSSKEVARDATQSSLVNAPKLATQTQPPSVSVQSQVEPLASQPQSQSTASQIAPETSAVPANITSAPTSTQPTPEMQQKLAQVEYTQDSLRTEVTQVSQRLSGVDSNLESLKNELMLMHQALSDMQKKMADDSEHMKHLLAAKASVVKKHVVRIPVRMMKYYIQAVIPGRAWLVAENGTTLTVRVGSILGGYGVIRAIDPNTGRVATSSGRVITFSQLDS